MSVMTTARYRALSRETDLAFVTRLLAEEGLIYRFQDDGPDDVGSAATPFMRLGAACSVMRHRRRRSSARG